MSTEKIDIVYTWVDGSDPIWLAKKQSFNKKTNNLSESWANVQGRFRDNNELLFSLRSLDTYFPEHGQVFIITDQQKPNFLNDKVIIIDHKEIMDVLPTYSSKKIESNIHKIKNLSQNFLYLNDDFFLGPQFSINDFFKNNIPQIHLEKQKHTNEEESHVNSTTLSKILLNKKYQDKYQHINIPMAHAPRAISKPLLIEFMNSFKQEYNIAQTELFRDKTIPALTVDTFQRWAIHHKLAAINNVPGMHIQTMASNLIVNQFFESISQYHYFCINDTSDDMEDDSSILKRFDSLLYNLFPKKSKYEQ